MDRNVQVQWIQNGCRAVSKEHWATLMARVPEATVFNDWAWASTSEAHLGAGTASWTLTAVGPNDELLALLAFRVSRERLYGLPVKVIRWLSYPFADRVVPLVDPTHPELIPRLLEALERAPFAWDCMIWNEVPGDFSLKEQWLEAAQQTSLTLQTAFSSVCPVLIYAGRAEAEIVAATSKTVLQRGKRARKRLQQEVDVQLRHFRPTPDQVPALVAEYKAVEDASWKGDEGVGIFSDPESREFFSDLAGNLAAAGQLDVGEIRIAGKLVSYRFGMRFRDVFLDYNLAFLPEHHKIGLGRILLDELVLSCARQGYRAIDGSRVGKQSRHLLFERANDQIEHQRWYWFRRRPGSLWVRLQLLWVKPWWQRIQQFRKQRQADERADAD
jgi:CelD/BcsL family acetyltransferase involved in cellulose biosynthesis